MSNVSECCRETAQNYVLHGVHQSMLSARVCSKIHELEEELKVVCNTMKSLEIYEQEVGR